MESNAAFEMRLLEFIDAYNAGSLTDIPLEILNQEADKVYSEEPDVNTYDEERIQELFSIEEYDKQRLILELIYYIVGQKWSVRSKDVTIEKLDEWGDAVMRYGFYKGLNLTRGDIERLIDNIEQNQKYIANNTRDINSRRGEYAKYYQTEYGESVTDETIIRKIHPNDDGAYTALPESINTMVQSCIKNEWYDLWLKIYELLGYAPLQGSIVYDLKTTEQLLGAVLAERAQHTTRRKVFAYLLSNRAFELLINQQDLLERNAINDELDRQHIELAKEALGLWMAHRSQYMHTLVKELFLGVMSMDDILKWLSEKNRMASGKRGAYKERDVMLIKELWEIMQAQAGVPHIDAEKADLNTLMTYIYNVEQEKMTKEQCSEIICKICKCIYTDEHMYIGWDFSDESIEQMRAIYSCLFKSGLDFIGLSMPFLSVNEGYKTTIEKHIKLQRANKIWLSAMMLQAEEAQDQVNEFARNEQFLFECAYKSDVDLIDNYMLPFLIGEAVVIEVAKENGKEWLKDKYEQKLINTINDLLLVITVLTLNEGVISDENKQILITRMEKEWYTAKAMNHRNPNIRICEDYINSYINVNKL